MNFRLYIIAIVAMFSVTSCNDVIDLKLDDPAPVLVVDGFISNQKDNQYVRLSSLENYFAEQPPNYSIYKSATVTLRENGSDVGTYVFNEVSEQFEIPYEGVIGNEYQIYIKLPDGSSYLSAPELMLDPIPIDSIWYDTYEDDGFGSSDSGYTVYIYAADPIGTGDFYQWKSYTNDVYENEAGDLSYANDRFVDGQEDIEIEVYSISNSDFRDLKAEAPNNKVIITIEQLKISERYYDFLALVDQQFDVGSPFASPPAEIRGNVYKQGEDDVLALGYFYAGSLDKAEIEIEE